ncbi:MAG: hypothetical protein GY750_20500 [Lentisphaerae bacterium]|nr:hypothetical protein [Lentisphaerota bacterium]MCP4103774.1 hypothetical protein [Lentisphaerota bacterium]
MRKTVVSVSLFLVFLFFNVLTSYALPSTAVGEIINPTDSRITYLGRYNTDLNQAKQMNWEGAGIALNVHGSGLTITLKSKATTESSFQAVEFRVYIYSGNAPVEYSQNLFSVPVSITPQESSKTIDLSALRDYDPSRLYHVEIIKTSEADDTSSKKETATVELAGITINADSFLEPATVLEKKIVYYGDSITAGFYDGTNGGTYGKSNLDISYAFQTTQLLNKALFSDFSASSLNASYTALSGIAISNNYYWHNNTLANFYNQKQYSYNNSVKSNVLDSENADVVVVNIGTNDMTGYFVAGDADGPTKYGDALKAFVGEIRTLNPNAFIILTLWGTYDPNSHSQYWDAIQKVVSDFNNNHIIPDSKVKYFAPYWSTSGDRNHPDKTFAGKFAAKLAPFIQSLLTSNLN